MPLLGQKRSTVKPEAILKQIRLMESLDTTTSEEAIATLRGWLLEGNGITQILKYYTSCQSIRALELLCSHVHEPFEKILLDQIADCLQKNVPGTIILLGRLINNGPSWLSKLPSHDIFLRLLELIKSGKNLEHVNSALFLMSSLLPYCPPSDQTVKEFFRSFFDACKLYHQKNKISVEKIRQVIDSGGHVDSPFVVSNIICLMQVVSLQSSLKVFFGALYGIYPNTVLTLLQKCVQGTNADFFINAIEPILTSCRTHPNILLENRDKELSLERWKELNPEELFALSEKVSINEPLIIDTELLPSSKQRLSERNFYCNDFNDIDASTLGCFKRGCQQSFALFYRSSNQLNTPPNEPDDSADYPTDLFESVNLDRLLDNSLMMNSNSSTAMKRLSPYFVNEHHPKQSLEDNDDRSKPARTRPSSSKPIKRYRSFSTPNTIHLKHVNDVGDVHNVKIPWSVAKIIRDTLNVHSENNRLEITKKQTESLRSEYMEEAENYHKQLMLLGLADRLPGKIYDDLHNIMKGLSIDNQKDLLESRLRLVNHHLLFERNCRLLLSKRSRQLFEKLKSHVPEETDLFRENKRLTSQIAQMNQRIQEQHNDKVTLQAKLHDKEQFYLNKLETAKNTIDELNSKLADLKHHFSTLEQDAKLQQRRLSLLLLNEEHKLIDTHFSDEKQEEIEHLRRQLSLTQQQNHELRERCESLQMSQNRPAPNEEKLQISKRSDDAQISSLKKQLQKSRDEVEEWKQRCKQHEQNYVDQLDKRTVLEETVARTTRVYEAQITATNQKYESLISICSKQEAHIAFLYGSLKKHSSKNTSARICPKEAFEETRCGNTEEKRTVDDHIFDLFGNEPNLDLIHRNNDFSVQKGGNFVPSSSLDTFVSSTMRHGTRRRSLTTLPVPTKHIVNRDDHKDKGQKVDNSTNSSSKTSTQKSYNTGKQTPDISHYLSE